MLKSSVSKIISGRPDRGVSKYMLEEVYFSDSCFHAEGNNPQHARFENGRYYFDFPDLWYNTLSNNKVVALRKIDIHAPSANIACDVKIKRYKAGASGQFATRTFRVALTISPGTTMVGILDMICREVNKEFSPTSRTKWTSDPEHTVMLDDYYNYDTNEALLGLVRITPTGDDPNKYYYGFELTNFNTDFRNVFDTNRIAYDTPALQDPKNYADGTMIYYFQNTWNREFCFVHASFVNGTSFNYLGRSGEFYPKPSKMYRFGGSSQQFYFELSYDGRTPITYVLGNFCIDLAFIYHDKDYQAE